MTDVLASTTMKTIIKCTVGMTVIAVSGAARATPVPLPFTYPYETLGKGELEVELYGDMTPLRVAADPTGAARGRLWEPRYLLQNEFEYGVTDHVELAAYQVFEASPLNGGTNAMTFDGFKFRVRVRLAEADEWPVDVALYLEMETLHDEYGLEEKVILAKRFGPVHWMANLWVEQAYARPFDPSQRRLDFVINPTTGFTYEVKPGFQPGVEYWARGEIGTQGDTELDRINRRVHHFAGPTLHFDWGKVWWSLGVYADLTNAGTPQPGEIYGPLWVRTLLGVTL
jgi:hypothetical protein